ncbi:hypothetical protein BU24DRAFT_435202 [Aaosphaeria arxii CBS 175.79]|uniref:25S rRNA adenine-N(1) methyltransferase n=1 Tax=Aaosphaeria arxii CBS 175.79 TaxID=1450172 RepID=A0A6A5XHZ0_9PLEO|nr:uncharacterized protein BU24DRAFT_435202 [Aaosphaeria arxii CBS 175.79]KAF2012858.1 hypothetical protein BU24DRAFT_435202 [Aaosphaeria arxii CBS 175.79]
MALSKRPKSLSHGRPPISKPSERMSSKQSRTIIRTHHRLHKEHAAAVRKGDAQTAARVKQAIEQKSNLKLYQAASKQGQSKDRGGDSSKLLVQWMQEHKIIHPNKDTNATTTNPYQLLEVGALSTKNEISRFPKLLQVTRIDLNSQEPGILQQNFMERPLPSVPSDYFDIISLSLVLNYVSDAVGRGEMLKRTTEFLRLQTSQPEAANDALPLLFLVLPLPCVANSRYLNEQLLERIMTGLGYQVLNKKNTNKLCYYLFKLTGNVHGTKADKRKVRDGPSMNNFCIVVE